MREYHANKQGTLVDVLILPNSKENKPKIDEWKRCVEETYKKDTVNGDMVTAHTSIHRVHFFQYDTFEDPQVYKTLPFIVDRLNEMRVRDQQRISKYMHSLNRACNELRCMDETVPFFNSSVVNTFDINYYKDLVKTDYMDKLFRMETTIMTKGTYSNSEYVPTRLLSTLFDYLRNYTSTKIKRCV